MFQEQYHNGYQRGLISLKFLGTILPIICLLLEKCFMRWFIRTISVFFALGLGISLTVQAQNESSLPVLYDAPELHDGIWLNTDIPLKLANLRGNVVLLEMWTFDCINCIRTLPFIQEWHEAYASEGLVVIGNHYPEFGYEGELANLRASIERHEVTYPILQDNERETWSAYNNRYWPTVYLIDKWGQVRYIHIGEGRYNRTEDNIQLLLAETYDPQEDTESETIPIYSLTPTEALNVRRGAGTQYGRIGLIMPGEAYFILGEVSGWYQILFNRSTAYVSADYITITSEAETP